MSRCPPCRGPRPEAFGDLVLEFLADERLVAEVTLEGALASSLGITAMKVDPIPWLRSRNVVVPDALSKTAGDFRWFGLMSLMVQYNNQNGPLTDEKK